MRVRLVQYALVFWALSVLAVATSIYTKQVEAFVAGVLVTVVAMVVIIDLIHPQTGML